MRVYANKTHHEEKKANTLKEKHDEQEWKREKERERERETRHRKTGRTRKPQRAIKDKSKSKSKQGTDKEKEAGQEADTQKTNNTTTDGCNKTASGQLPKVMASWARTQSLCKTHMERNHKKRRLDTCMNKDMLIGFVRV